MLCNKVKSHDGMETCELCVKLKFVRNCRL